MKSHACSSSNRRSDLLLLWQEVSSDLLLLWQEVSSDLLLL